MAAAQSPVLEPLIANQRDVHQGQPGGLGQAMTVAEREAALLFCQRNKPEKMRHPCTTIRSTEDLAMDWVEDQFAERASDTWRRVTAVTKRTATTSGIGPNSVLYRSLRDMLYAYPAHGVKNHIMARKSKELVWTPTKTVVEIHSAFMAYYEAYDRAVALTAGIVDVTLVVPAQDWATRFTEMQSHFPSWVTTLIIDYPGRFADMESCWAAIIAEASRQATSRKIGNGGRILQLTNEAMTAGELEGGLGESGVLFNDDVDVAYTDTSGISIFALGRQQVPGCWRCGDKNHLRRDCTLAASKAELEGAIMAIPYTGLSFAASCNSRSSHGQYTRSSTEHYEYGAVTSVRLLGQNYRNRKYSKVRNYVLDKHFSSNNQQWQPPLPDRPCAQHVQSTRRMSLTVKRPSTQGLSLQLKGRL
jgi:hypothetical protein